MKYTAAGDSWNKGMKYGFQSAVLLIATVFVISNLYVSRESRGEFYNQEAAAVTGGGDTSFSSCDFSSGKWVYDERWRPLYNGTRCSFMDDGMACEKYGRKNLKYLHWRWQPHGCDLPVFNASFMLEKLRNKRVVFVGDSLNRNQWVSLVCMLESSIPEPLKSVQINGSLVTFKATEYNASIDFYWAPLLLESNCDELAYHRVSARIIRAKSIEKHAQHWTNSDVLVFNSYIWWRYLKLNVLWGSFGSETAIYEDIGMLSAYEMALQTLSDWLYFHVNRTRTKLFFVSMSPTHNRGEEWGKPQGERCYNETEPIVKEGYWGMDSDPRMMRLVEEAIKKLRDQGLKVKMLNITQLSEYRKEAHSSIYRKYWDPLSKEQLENPSRYADCTHWCLPGVPDVWNTFLYAYLFFS